uniref:Small ribosomal subunit protein uS14m n=1 Tax=Nephroselmis olivacea TaxID=31312 RepID=Q9TCB4_NEPOL|nr:ribosomal protein S14 [Nephroselmis olivacea]AAF03183.1 ribosomal protein S14 [Nephroselmis olivacea]
MVNSIQRDKKRRLLSKSYELLRMQYQSIIKNRSIPQDLRYSYILKLTQLPRNSSMIRLKNRCVITGRSKSVYRFCRLSRISFRELASKGLLMGITKSSW